jgi:glutathione S-transferase
MTRVLYHFSTSPYSRRSRLALAHKGLEPELRDARADPSQMEIVRAKWPFGTVPLLDDDGTFVGDSTAIARYLDARYPENRIFTDDPRELRVTALVDGTLDHVIAAATRYEAAWKTEGLARAEKAAVELAAIAPSLDGWTAAEMWLYAMVTWFDGLSARAETNANVKKIVATGFTLPSALSPWAAKLRAKAGSI